MNKKSVLTILSLIFLTSCSSLKESVRDIGNFLNREVNTKTDITDLFKDVEEKPEELISESVSITDSEVGEHLSYIRNSVRENKIRTYTHESNKYSVYMGEYLNLMLDGENSAKVVDRNAPSYKIDVKNNRLSFMSIYRGVFNVQLFSGNEYSKTIRIETVPRYSITESNILNVIERNTKNDKILEDAITLYKLHYPKGRNYSHVNYILMKHGYDKRNTSSGRSLMLEGFEEVKNYMNHFDDDEIKNILSVASLVKRTIEIPYSKYSNDYLKEDIKKYILSRPKYEDNSVNEKYDMAFLERYYKNNEDSKEEIKALLTSYYKRIGDNSKLNELENVKTVDTSRYKKDDISTYKQMLSKETNFNNKAMLYYKIGREYAKNGNKIQARKYLTIVVQQFKNTQWEKESRKLLDSLK